MTERKPAGMGFTSWIDQQISEAAERGAFDDLPGTGKPLPNRGEADDGQVWLRDYLRKEGVSTDVRDAVAAPSSARAGDGPQVGDGSDRPRSRWRHRRSSQRRPAGH
jgi:hypothetical protein